MGQSVDQRVQADNLQCCRWKALSRKLWHDGSESEKTAAESSLAHFYRGRILITADDFAMQQSDIGVRITSCTSVCFLPHRMDELYFGGVLLWNVSPPICQLCQWERERGREGEREREGEGHSRLLSSSFHSVWVCHWNESISCQCPLNEWGKCDDRDITLTSQH